MSPQGGAVPIIPIRDGSEVSAMPKKLSMPPGVLPSTPVLITYHVFLVVNKPPVAASTKISFFKGIRSVSVVNIIAAIPGVVGWVNIGMAWKLNIVCSKIMLVV